MKKILISLLFVTLHLNFVGCDSASKQSETSTTAPAATASSASANFSKEEAEKLIKRLATQDGCKDSNAEMRMSFTDADGKAQQLDFRVQRKFEDTKTSTLVTIIAPKEDQEKAILGIEEAGKPTDAISYLAGLKKTARLKSDNPLNFHGSKSTVQEMLSLEFNQYTVGEISTGTSPGSTSIQLIAKPDLNLAYPKINVIVKGKDQVDRFELLNDKGEKVKTIKAAEIKSIQNHQSITKMEIEDHKNQQKLQAEIRTIKYDSNLPTSIFTEENLIKNVTAASVRLMQ